MNSSASSAAPKPSEGASILGISAYYHDSAACLVRNGTIIAAAQEERFSREKNDASFPKRAVEYCLRAGQIGLHQVDYVAFYEKPFLKFDRLLHSYLTYAPAGLRSFLMAIPIWIKEKIWMKEHIRVELGGYQGPILFPDHHETHAASAFFPSPFQEAAFLTVDGVGEWTTTSFGTGQGNKLEFYGDLHFPHSLGLLYSAFTYYTGFKVNSGEYKLMGLAPYGRPAYKDLILRELIDLKDDGSFKLNMRYFNYGVGLTMTNAEFDRLFGGPPRQPESRLTQRDMDVAKSIQEVTEEIMTRMARHIHRQTGQKHLCLAGGVALNCVANGRILREGPFERIWIQPAAGDAGGALGAALAVWHQYLGHPRHVDGEHDSQQASLLGPSYGREEILRFLKSRNIRFAEMGDEELPAAVADLLAAEKVIGWFNGRMEFGPRALGARSIIGDPRSRQMQAVMNLKIKFRESFRPFAPCVLRERVDEWFDMKPNEDSPYMLLVAPVLEKHRAGAAPAEIETLRADGDLVRWVNTPRSGVPAITHVDYSARVQTVDERHGRFRRVMEKFYEKTGCPIIVNTSFNLSWEPIVCTPSEAYHTFMQSEMDALVLGDYLLRKAEQPLGFRAWAESLKGAPDPSSPWADPRDGQPLVVTPTGAINPATGARYPVEDGIPRLFVASEEAAGEDSKRVEKFYDKTPSPDYENMDHVRALQEKARRGIYAWLLNEQIPYDARVVEIGCGTGQLTNYLAVAHRSVLGADLCLNSLRLAQRFKTAQGLTRAAFAQMNPCRPALRDGFFDFIICNATRHFDDDPAKALARVSRLAKPGGFVLIGLHNRYGRRLHQLRSDWLNTGRAAPPGLSRKSYSMDDVLGWLDQNDLEFVNAIPKAAGGPPVTSNERLFEPKSPGTAVTRIASQFRSTPGGFQEGGVFVVITRRR